MKLIKSGAFEYLDLQEEKIALILGVDRFFDMCRTVPNITGNAAGSVIMAASEGK